uniref:Smr/MutS family protein n=1 Tax=Mycoplasmopsis bovis TaxID=28903 RepID=UPI003D2E1D68
MSKKSRNNTIQYDNNDYSNIVDLHGFTIAEALTQVQLSLANAYESDFYYDYVTIITGKGYTRTKKVDISKFADVFLLEIKMAKQLSVNEWKYLFEKYEKYR